ncbi:hypothetical protein RJZ56_002825 [Blastomyces dermatitidis]
MKAIKDSEKEVAIEFADGSVESSDIVVGADGIHSAIRKHIVPDVKPGYSGLMAINSACSRRQEVDGSHVLIGAQQRFPEKDKEGWDALAADKQGLLDMLRDN